MWTKVIFAVRSGRKMCGVIRSGLGGCQYINEEEGVGEERSEKERGGSFECSCPILPALDDIQRPK